jgi:hypothetical protein
MEHGLPDRLFLTLAPWLLLITESVLVIAAVVLTFLTQRKSKPGSKTPVFLSRQGAF